MVGIIKIHFARNNIFFTLSCTHRKKLIFSYSARELGFINFKKNFIPIIVEGCFRIKQKNDFKFFILKIKGLNKSRNLLIKQMFKLNIPVIKIIDLNITPFNGCRVSCKRRI